MKFKKDTVKTILNTTFVSIYVLLYVPTIINVGIVTASEGFDLYYNNKLSNN